MYEMKPEYYIGIETIDQQHAQLFALADKIYVLMKDDFTPDKFDNIVTVIHELRDYTDVHFKDEEAYMESISYKKLFTQKIEHAAFIQKIDDIDFASIDENQDAYIMELLDFLNTWLVDHILEKDMLINAQ